MKFINRLDRQGINNLGIDFDSSEEMDRFINDVTKELYYRIGKKLLNKLPEEKIEEYEMVMNKYPISMREFLECYYPFYRFDCVSILYDMRVELVNNRDNIKGLSKSSLISWNARLLDYKNEDFKLELRDWYILKDYGVITRGELYSMDNNWIREVLGIKQAEVEKVEKIRDMLEESRMKAVFESNN